MSKHWHAEGKISRIRPVGDPREWLSPEAYDALSPADKRAIGWASKAAARRRRLPEGAKAGLVLVAAACVGVAIGMYEAFGPRVVVAPGAIAQKIETILPEVQADIADVEWEGRAHTPSVIASEREAIQPGSPRASGPRNDGVRIAFTRCHTGGGTDCVVDGDTFYLGGDKVRIAGIDAPETHSPRCAYEARLGGQATQELHALLNSGAVTMTGIGRDRDTYGRLLRNVAVDGRDVGGALIAAGVARQYGSGRRSWC